MLIFGGAVFIAAVKTANPPIKLPVDLWPMTLFDWLSNGVNLAVGILALAATLSAVTAFKRLFIDKSGAKKEDLTKDGRKTREGLEHVSRQLAAGIGDILAGIEKLRLERLAKNEGNAQQIESFATTATDLAQSESATDQAVAREVVEGDPLTASDQLIAEAQNDVTRAAERYRQAARIAAPYSLAKAITAYARAVELDSDDFAAWIEISRLQQITGSLMQAQKSAENGFATAKCDRDIMVAYGELGNIFSGIGCYDDAKNCYSNALSLANSIYNDTPSDVHILRDIGVVHNKLGDIYGTIGHDELQKMSYEKAIMVFLQLISYDINNIDWNRDLELSYNKLGDYFLHKISNFDRARICYESALAISEKLSVEYPINNQFQHDLAMSYERLGNVAMRNSINDIARINYDKKFQIIKNLTLTDPQNARWQRDLSLTYNSFGDLDRYEDNFESARQAYMIAFAISQQLAANDPLNSQWQHDVSACHDRLGLLAEASGDIAGAIREFEAGEAILVALIARVGDHPGFARDLAQVRRDIARLRGK